ANFLDADYLPVVAAYNYPATCCDVAHLFAGSGTPSSATTCDSRDLAGTHHPYAPNLAVVPLEAGSADLCVFQMYMGAVSRCIKTFQYPNVELMFWNTINYTGWSDNNTHPEPFSYETGFAIRNGLQAQQKQEAGGYAS